MMKKIRYKDFTPIITSDCVELSKGQTLFDKEAAIENPNCGAMLYDCNFADSEEWKDSTSGVSSKIESGVTFNSFGADKFIYLNREYGIDKICCSLTAVLYNSSVLRIGHTSLERDNKGTNFELIIDCSNKLINIKEKGVQFKFVSGREYTITLCYDNCILHGRITDNTTAESFEVVNKSVTFKDAFCISASGTSPLLKKFSVYTLVNNPYLYFVGDSITEGTYLEMDEFGTYPTRFANLIGDATKRPYLVSGRGGGDINGILGNGYVGKIDSEIIPLKPKFVMITIGTNGSNTDEKLSNLVERIKNAGITPILNNVPCRREGSTDEQYSVKNTLIETVRKRYNIKGCLFNLATSVNYDGVTTDSTLYNDENPSTHFYIHPNADGHKRMSLRPYADCPEIFIEAGVI